MMFPNEDYYQLCKAMAVLGEHAIHEKGGVIL